MITGHLAVGGAGREAQDVASGLGDLQRDARPSGPWRSGRHRSHTLHAAEDLHGDRRSVGDDDGLQREKTTFLRAAAVTPSAWHVTARKAVTLLAFASLARKRGFGRVLAAYAPP